MKAAFTALAIVLGISGCTTPPPPMHPTRSVVQVKNVAKVALREVDNDVLEFTVWNNGTQPIVVDRDEIVLDTDHGPRSRRSDGDARTFNLPPGTAQEVDVRFDWTGLHDTTVRVRFDGALTIRGRALDVSAIEIHVF
jgi:hypothetical protein